MNGLVIHTDRLVLSVPSRKDAARMSAYVRENREHLRPWEPARPEPYFTEAFWRQELPSAAKEFRAGSSLRLFAALKEDPSGPVAGTCNFRNFVWGVFKACHLGYSLDHRLQRRGLMREALEASLAYVFGELRLHRVMAAYMPKNERSGKLLKSLGFEVEGYARDYLLLDGAWRDHVLTSKLRPETDSEPPPGSE
jgi:[ribosomal protein S5]-alanine N-acetyltransferase